LIVAPEIPLGTHMVAPDFVLPRAKLTCISLPYLALTA
jgi:hypothetical protein